MRIATLPVALQGPANHLPALIQSQRTRPGFVPPLYHPTSVSFATSPGAFIDGVRAPHLATARTRCPAPPKSYSTEPLTEGKGPPPGRSLPRPLARHP